MMQTAPLENYKDLISEGREAGRETFSALNRDGVRCRLSVFTPDLSADEHFRSAWRRDLGLLRLLSHDGLPEIIDSGDAEGIVYLATESVADVTLGRYLETNSLAWDEVADIGWQIASVMQHLHNSGVAHGGLDETSVRITPQLRVSVVDTGVGRWLLAAGEQAGSAGVNRQCRHDLVSLGHLLRKLAIASQGTDVQPPAVPGEWWELIEDLSDSSSRRFPATAREVQGRLGRILLEDSGEVMKVVAARTGLSQVRSSILDEFLPLPSRTYDELPRPHKRKSGFWIWLLVAFAAIAVMVMLLQRQ